MNKEINDLQKKDMIREVSEGGNLKFAMSDIPVRKFYDQALYLEEIVLPAIAKKSGVDSQDYKFYRELYKSLLYAVMIVDRGDKLLRERQRLNMFINLYKSENETLQKELMKYTTMEDMYMTEAMDKISSSVAERVENILNNKNK
jgi:hypothetical protein